MAQPKSAAQQDAMMRQLADLPEPSDWLVWLGGKYIGGQWTWDDGTAIGPYTNWADGEGSHGAGPGQPWLCMDWAGVRGPAGSWHDCHGNGERYQIVCQSA